MKKRGQFYIIAAAIISVLLVGLAATVNSAVTSPAPIKFYDMGQSYNLEASKLIDYGVYNPGVDITDKLQNFTNQFYDTSVQKDPNLELLIVYGNSTNATYYNYGTHQTTLITGTTQIAVNPRKTTGSIGLQTNPGTEINVDVSQNSKNFFYSFIPGSQPVKIQIINTNYTVDINEGQNFYFVILSQKPSGEINVQTG